MVQKRRRAVQERRARLTAEAAASLTSTLPENLQRAVEIASDQGASHWISALPLTAHGFALPKGAFRDALCLRYGWQPPHLPLHCPCGKPFDADHALSCGTGGYSIMRHNEVRDLTASLLSEVCGDVQIEPTLIPLSGEAQFYRSANVSPDARLDVSARGFWGRPIQPHDVWRARLPPQRTLFKISFCDQPIRQTREGEAATMRATSKGRRRSIFCTTGLLHFWRNGPSRRVDLQAVGKPALREIGPELLCNGECRAVSSIVCASAFGHHGSPWITPAAS